jgi:branched-chain amino acid transport system ATP-binding protein
MKLEPAAKAVPLLDVRGVSAGYGGMPVLRDVTLHIQPAEVVARVGSNGARLLCCVRCRACFPAGAAWP